MIPALATIVAAYTLARLLLVALATGKQDWLYRRLVWVVVVIAAGFILGSLADIMHSAAQLTEELDSIRN